MAMLKEKGISCLMVVFQARGVDEMSGSSGYRISYAACDDCQRVSECWLEAFGGRRMHFVVARGVETHSVSE